MLKLHIPQQLHSRSVDALGLSGFAKNRLLAKGIKTLGQLHGMTVGEIGGLPGVGTQTLDEIIAAIRAVANGAQRGVSETDILVDPQKSTVTSGGEDPNTEEGSNRSVLVIPSSIAHWPISTLSVPGSVTAALDSAGVRELRDLNGWTPDGLRSVRMIGAKAVTYIERALRTLDKPPSPSVFRRGQGGVPLPPRAPLDFFRLVERANSPGEEIDALLHKLSPRDADMVRLRWARHRGRTLTLEEIAVRHGITRERTRQITQRRDDLLRSSNLWLPQLTAVVAVIESAGGALPEPDLVKRAAACGVYLDSSVLPYLESISALGLIPRVAYSDRAKLWVSESGVAEWLSADRVSELQKRVKRQVAQVLHDTGCIPVSLLATASRFGVRHALSLAQLSHVRFRRGSGYLLPVVPADSTMLRWVEQMLAVTPELTLDDIAAGLRRGKIVRRRQRARLEVPPLDVLRELLIASGRFIVGPETVQAAHPKAPTAVLSPTEQVVVAAIEARGNVASWSQIIEAATAAGCAEATAALALSEPFIARKTSGIYALRGRPIAPEVLRAAMRERAASRRECVKRVVVYEGGTRARVVYRLTRFTSNGVLPVPGKLRKLATTTWRARVPGGRELQVHMRKGFISPLRRWFKSDNLQVGDLIVADFDIANAVINLDVAS